MTFRRVLAEEDLWEGDMSGVAVAGTRVLVVRLAEGVRAYEDRCAHLGVALSEGRLADGVITCRAHEYQYDACTGRGINPASACLRRFPVAIRDGAVWVEVDPGDARDLGDAFGGGVPAGQLAGPPSELLGSERMLTLLESLRDRYDHVLLDTSAMLGATDSQVLSAFCDGVLFVVRSGKLKRRDAMLAMEKMERVGPISKEAADRLEYGR